jgi:hypothetical protein
MFFNPQTIDKAISDIQKAIGSIDVEGLLLVREDLQAELAIMAPTDTPVRNRLNRIQGEKHCPFYSNSVDNLKRSIPSQAQFCLN